MTAATDLQDPVFIVGGRRSGSSLLYRTLQKHSHFRPRIEHLVESKFFQHLPDAHRWDRTPPQAPYDFLMYDTEELDRFLATTRRWRLLRAPFAPVHRRLVSRPTPLWWWRLSGASRITQEYFAAAHRARGARRLLEKTPANFSHIDELLSTFPSARALYIARHPIDTYTSHLRRAREDESAAWAAIGAEEFVRYWTRATEFVLRASAEHGDRFRHLRYERFTAEPVDEFSSLCDFLDVPFEDGCVDEPAPDLTRHAPDPHLFGRIVTTTKDWRSWVDEGEASRMEDRLAEPMRAFGYERYTDA